jgi:hypothetical protein
MLAGELGPTDILVGSTGTPPGAVMFRAVATGAFLFFGALMAVSGLGWIASFGIHYGSAYGWTVVGLGIAVMLFGVFNFFWFGRVFSRRATRITVSSRGLSATLVDGQVIDADWTDPSLRVDITNTSSGDADKLLWLSWQVRTEQVFGTITRSGSTLIEAESARKGLRIDTRSYGRPTRPTVLVRIRPKRNPPQT